MSTYKAIRVQKFGDPSVLKVEELPLPSVQPTQVLVKLLAAGINPVETYIRSGVYGKLPALPYTPGNDGAGVVEAVGENVKNVKVGDRVFTTTALTGTYAQYTVAEEDGIAHLPEAVSFTQGAAIWIPYATAYRALIQRGGGRAGESVFIHGGSGAVGQAAIQIAASHGFRPIIATAGTEEGKKFVKSLGADLVLDHHQTNYLEEIVKFTEGKGVDIILEMLANVNLGKDLTVLAKNGRVLVIGSRGPVEINPRDTMARDADIRGVALMNMSTEDRKSVLAAIRAGLANGTLKPHVSKSYKLSEAPQAHEDVMKPSGALGKLVLEPHN